MEPLGRKSPHIILPLSFLVSGVLSVIMAIVIPVSFISLGGITDGWLFEPAMLAITVGLMLPFLLGGIWLIRSALLWKRLPDVLIESDGEHLYLHGKKEGKFPLADLEGAFIHGVPDNFFINHLADRYGTVSFKLADGRKFKVPYVSFAGEVPEKISRYYSEV